MRTTSCASRYLGSIVVATLPEHLIFLLAVFNSVGLIIASDHIEGHWTASEFHSLPHQTSQMSRTSFKVVLISWKNKVDLFRVIQLVFL